MEEIKKMMTQSPMTQKSRREATEGREGQGRAFEELVRENQELKKNIDILNGRLEANVNEFYLQRNDLETKMEELERHYREKQLQDEFTIATLKSKNSMIE